MSKFVATIHLLVEADTDRFIFRFDGSDHTETFEGQDGPEGERIYAIGAWGWCWDRVDPRT